MTEIKNLINEQVKKENEIFENALRQNATPKIKGEITKGKLRWRGIRIVHYNEFMKSVKWMEQRGKQISPKIILDCLVNFYPTLPNSPHDSL